MDAIEVIRKEGIYFASKEIWRNEHQIASMISYVQIQEVFGFGLTLTLLALVYK